jgi:hypothetical protein
MYTLHVLCLLAFACPASAGASGENWWCDKSTCYDEDLACIEAIIIIVLVVLAVLFDTAHHHLEHFADGSYWYGKLQSSSVAPESGRGDAGYSRPFPKAIKQRTPLFKHWVDRMSKEFMVLGFLAFVVFVFREAGFFEWLVNVFPASNYSHIHLPKTPEDWLHMVENVHMKLFLGMIVYFLLILKVVEGCSKHVQFWEEMRILRRSQSCRAASQAGDFGERSTSDVLGHTRLRRYGRWRLYFIKSVMTWRETRPRLYEETLKHLGTWSCDTPTQRRLHCTLDEVFPFSAYLAYSVRTCCKDTVDVHCITWAAVILLFSIFALIHRYAKLILLHFMPFFIVCAFLLLYCVSRLVRVFRQHVEMAGSKAVHTVAAMEDAERRTSASISFDLELGTDASDQGTGTSTSLDKQKSTSEGFHERHATELWVFRTLQICLFVLSYSCAHTIGDANDWRNRPEQVLAVSSGFITLFLVLGNLLPKYVPNFAALMAMPPYCDQSNVQTFFEVIDEYHPEHRKPEPRLLKPKEWAHGIPTSAPSKAGQGQESSGSSLGCAEGNANISTLVKQQNTPCGQVKEMQAILELPGAATDSDDSDPVIDHAYTQTLKSELMLMRAQLARCEVLMQCAHYRTHAERASGGSPNTYCSFLETESVRQSSPKRDASKTPLSESCCSAGRDEVPFDEHSRGGQISTKTDRHVHYAEEVPGLGADRIGS